MSKQYTIIIFFVFLSSFNSFAQEGGIKGRIIDAVSGEALLGANVVIEGSTRGASTDLNGSFIISNLVNGQYDLKVSFVGYDHNEISVTVSGAVTDIGEILLDPYMFDDQVVISASRRAEKLTESPATIEVISAKDIEQLPSFNPGELLARVKGVDFIRSGVVGTGINIRGFNSNFNAKNLQVNDGRISTLIATGLPLGPLTTQIKEDVQRVEVVLGPNSALYGPNAHNGLVHTISKDPRTSQGTTFALGAGNQSTFSARARHAQVLSDKWSFKVTGEYTRGEEFEFVDSVYIDRNGDGIKEGYPELELDRDFEFLKGEAALYYAVTDAADIILSYGGSNSTYLAPTNVGRNQIIDWKVNYLHLRYTSPHFFAQVYNTWSKTEDTYSIDERTKQYYRGLDAGLPDAEARGGQSFSSGALFIDDSKRWNAEVQYNNEFAGFDVVVGAQWQKDMANSHGTYLLDEDEDDFIEVDQIGVYGQVQKPFGDSGFEGLVAFRADNHDIYDFNFVPKVGLLKHGELGTWRITYGQGIAAPTILNMFGDLFSGLILGNAEGFTLADGSTVPKQEVEKLQTFELGYKGQLIPKKLFVDANAYYNISEDFLSPVTVVGVTTKRGDTPIEEVQSGFAVFGGLVATYINFGQFDTYGADLGLNYYFSDHFNVGLNYSYFDYGIDEDDMENDFNEDGTVNILDILVNAPNHKASIALNANKGKFFGTLFTRWVQEYDYFSSFQIAAETQDLVYRGTPVVEGARGTDSFNYGPLGGFVSFDVGAGYKFNKTFTLSAQVTNLFDSEIREFTASPFIGRLYSAELKIDLPAIK